MAIDVDQNIFRFQIAVYDSLFMQRLNPQQDLAEEKARLVFWEALMLAQMEEQLPARDIVQYKEQPIIRLECEVQMHHKVAICQTH